MKAVFSSAIFALVGSLVAIAGPIKEPTYEAISNYYARVSSRLISKDGLFRVDGTVPLRAEMIERGREAFSMRADILRTSENSRLNLIISGKSAEIFLLSDRHLNRHIETNATQRVPTLTVGQAVERAKRYLVDLEVVLPTNAVLKRVLFNSDFKSVWEVRWAVQAGGFAYDEFLRDDPTVVVLFHEEHGFCVYGNDVFFPLPKSTAVKISQEDAILKASKVAPLVMQTRFYRDARASGFKVTGVESAELKIAAPNWLLNPARAIWIREKPPEETRLCWVVRFKTTDTVDRGKMKLSPVDILIYIDAATGEVVGANFT
jgi:hypothetical protein